MSYIPPVGPKKFEPKSTTLSAGKTTSSPSKSCQVGSFFATCGGGTMPETNSQGCPLKKMVVRRGSGFFCLGL